jgi:hypothetical protein
VAIFRTLPELKRRLSDLMGRLEALEKRIVP